MKKFFVSFIIGLLAFLFVGLYYYIQWKPLWSLEKPRTIYSVIHHEDDTLRIVMIGDSWVGMRSDTLNKSFQIQMSTISGRSVILKSKGRGGEKSRGIYQLIFEENGMGTKTLLESGADYCVLFAGINDAAANLGKKQFVYHMKLIVDFLLANDIRPIIIEIPDVDIWNVYSGKPFKDLIVDYIRSLMTQSGIYNYPEYREALKSMLKGCGLIDSVIYVKMSGWNGDSAINKCLFLDDQIHLNHQGYLRLDSCIIDAILKDLQ